MQASTQVTQSKKGGISRGFTDHNGKFVNVGAMAYIYASDDNMNDVQLGFNDPAVMEKLAQDLLEQAAELKKEIEA